MHGIMGSRNQIGFRVNLPSLCVARAALIQRCRGSEVYYPLFIEGQFKGGDLLNTGRDSVFNDVYIRG